MTTERPCPDAARLQRHLQGTLAQPDESEFIAHLNTCEICQRSLETMAADGDWLMSVVARTGREPATIDSRLSAVLDGLRTAGEILEPVNDAANWRDLLAPSDDTRYLGRLGQYAIISLVGQGGMGIVLKAFDEKLERIVAIKLLSPWMTHQPTAHKRFVREARAAAAVRHDNVVVVHDVQETGGIPFLVMELIEGQSLQERLDEVGSLKLTTILEIGKQAAEALAAAHAQGLIHRDIKPANILLERPHDRVKITDFGLARALEEATLTHSGTVAGTPGYMSPEQARGEPVDHRADLFSLGSVLYAMCTGRAAFRATGALATLEHVCDSEPEPIAALNPTIPTALVELIAKLQAKNPNNRFRSAAEVIAALEACEDHGRQTILPSVDHQRRTFSAQRILVATVFLAVGTVLAAQIVIRIRDNDGKTTEINFSKGTSIAIEVDGKAMTSTASGQALPADGEIRQFVGHQGVVFRVALTRDAKRIVSASTDASARVWDTTTGEETGRFEGHASAVYCAALSPDDRHVLSGSGGTPGRDTPEGNWSVCLWELESGKALNRLDGRGDSITSIAFDADGRRALIASYNGTVLLWDVENWRELTRFQETRGLWSVCFSPDENQALVAGGDSGKPILRLWDLSSPKVVIRLDGHDGGCWHASFTPDGQRILTTGGDRMIRLWDIKTRSVVQKFRASDVTTGAAISADGKRLLSGNYGVDKTVLLWNVETGEQLKAFARHTNGVQSVAMSRDGRWAVSGGHDRTIRLWRLPIAE
jgi:serine/threonine protein kinase